MVGLGNPGADYDATRHNAGFWLADALAARWKLPRFRREGLALATGGATPAGRVHILKPQTFMNRSGSALSGLRAPDPDAPLKGLLVLVDDFALPVGAFRIRARGSSGGHNGLESVEEALGTPHYARLRIGIGPVPEDVEHHSEFVLAPLPEAERAIVGDLMPLMADAVQCWMTEGVERAMARFNRKTPKAE